MYVNQQTKITLTILTVTTDVTMQQLQQKSLLSISETVYKEILKLHLNMTHQRNKPVGVAFLGRDGRSMGRPTYR